MSTPSSSTRFGAISEISSRGDGGLSMFNSGILPTLRSSDRRGGTPLTSANLPSVDASESDFATQAFERVDHDNDDDDDDDSHHSQPSVTYVIPGESLTSKILPAVLFFGSASSVFFFVGVFNFQRTIFFFVKTIYCRIGFLPFTIINVRHCVLSSVFVIIQIFYICRVFGLKYKIAYKKKQSKFLLLCTNVFSF